MGERGKTNDDDNTAAEEEGEGHRAGQGRKEGRKEGGIGVEGKAKERSEGKEM